MTSILEGVVQRGTATNVRQAVPGTPLAQELRHAGFLHGRGAFSVELAPLADDLPLDLMRDPNRWNIAGGDFDVI